MLCVMNKKLIPWRVRQCRKGIRGDQGIKGGGLTPKLKHNKNFSKFVSRLNITFLLVSKRRARWRALQVFKPRDVHRQIRVCVRVLGSSENRILPGVLFGRKTLKITITIKLPLMVT